MIVLIKAISIGQASYDIHIKLADFPKEDTKQRFVNKIACGGGAASNVAYLLGKWGMSSTFSGVVGNDIFGNRIKKELESVGVLTRYIETSYEKDTNISFILVNTKNSSRTLFNVADEYVKLKKFDFDFQPDVIFVDGHDPYASKETFNHFPKAIKIVDAERYNQDIINLGLMADYLICSMDFAINITKITPDYNNVSTLASIYDELRKKFEHQNVIVTMGSHGAMYMVDNQIKVSPSLKVNVCDTSSALDVFCGAFTYGISNNFGIEKSIKYGNIAAALSLQNVGRRLSIPKLDDVVKIYEKNS